MSSHGDISSSVKSTWFSEGLAASRWAPGGIEEQKIARQMVNQQTSNQKVNTQKTNTQNINDKKTNHQKKSIQETVSDKASTSRANGLASSRWAAHPNETAIKKSTNTPKKGNQQIFKDKAHVQSVNGLTKSRWAASPAETTHSTVKVNEAIRKPNQKKNPHENPTNLPAPVINTKATARRIIGELSEEEKAVKMENPFFDPEKHKGLASSRWAN
ncbi:hypothetical protein N8I77_006227 [Diaporthe amygdali]|uniref:Uncharacterized protein n=1 Tax=Phomopsis amygdali TaxID=1214568 RepID=A0AAD9SHC8_PHOAM|nr:hypothetical protein N8I77_006227 [Diaporthe amygdali]